MRRRPITAVLVAAAALLSGLALGEAHGAPAIVELRVMTLNVLYGGDELDLRNGRWCARPDGCPETLAKVVEAIEESDADVVGLEEAERNTRQIADALGWFANERTQVISRYPLVDPPGAGGMYVFVELTPGRVAAIANVHLTSDPYGPYAVRDGATAAEVLALEQSLRLPELLPRLAVLPPLAAAGIPVFLVGDFNAPSHLDWTPAVAAVRPEVRYPLEWPVSLAAEQAGLRDSYREVYPDPVAKPGFTWTPGGPESDRAEVHDRIDLVLSAGPVTTIDSEIVGEANGLPDVDIEIVPYPTDHRGVVSTFAVTPGVPPLHAAVESRRLSVGDSLGVVFHAVGAAGERIAVVPAGGAASSAVAAQATGAGAPVDGRVTFPTSALSPDAYEAVLLSPADTVISRSPFWLYAVGSRTEVAVGKPAYRIGEPIDVRWRKAPGMRWDWVSIYAPGNADEQNPVAQACNAGGCTNSRYLFWLYTGATVEGSAVFDATTGFAGVCEWPLKPGMYEVQLLLDDGYRAVASSARFKVVR